MIGGALHFLLVLVLVITVPVACVWLLVQVFRALFWLLSNLGRAIRGFFRHVARFVRGTVMDSLHLVGALIAAIVLVPIALMNLVFLRFSGVKHYAGAIEDELTSAFLCAYRLVLGNPAQLLGLSALTDGIERRVPELVARAPRARRSGAKPEFPGYKVTGSLQAGGSGAELFLARPLPETLARWRAAGRSQPEQVVIKSFALRTGSTLPQIVRESRALEAAGRLELVHEHHLDDESFYYVMPYVPGDDMNAVISRLHARGGPDGLRQSDVPLAISYATDLLATLQRFHAGGLWHKDIKPSNLIVSDERVHLVDLGLVTPLASAMTLTTHGTEYYRDPEMVRLAMQGVKVHEVDGVKFDLYSTGAVIYSIVQNSFPAQGSLSSITKRCPAALSWIVRRAMADIKDRYSSADEMLLDLRVLAAARDPFAVRPADLPSLGGRPAPQPFAPVDEGVFRGRVNARVEPLEVVDDANGRVRRCDRGMRRRASRGLAAAAIWSMLIAGAVSALVRLGSENDRGTTTTTTTVTSRTVAAAADAAWAHDLQRWTAELAAESAGAPATVLLLQDLAPAAASELQAALQGILRSDRVELLGAPWNETEDERDILYAAGARRAVGLSGPEDPDAVARLEAYLVDQVGLDAVLWLAPGAEEREVVYRIVRRRAEDPLSVGSMTLPVIAGGH
ncbi:MAG: hypothetical protein H6831_05575 [Planctomycetes bacterium]|nr:hypothetical protein [Planctomycetota bacterium]MCB9903859.1 hypothetical protein [Planctomycetota bacterium]